MLGRKPLPSLFETATVASGHGVLLVLESVACGTMELPGLLDQCVSICAKGRGEPSALRFRGSATLQNAHVSKKVRLHGDSESLPVDSS